ncbi:MAG: NUDIX hydrolase [Alphaproteobacteria bacterium]|nr:NUDIX hydrolase [Alphaproteobacteria bacterium]
MSPRDVVLACVNSITPVDTLEDQQIRETIKWIQGGEPLFRIQKPAIPERHLVSYFVLFDEEAQKILLVDHIKAGLWLPSGGHVEIDEDPRRTVMRECHEELGVEADFFQDDPLFLTITKTVGMTAGHTDVSLWYVLRGDHRQPYDYDASEFKGIRWFDFDQIPFAQSDPHLSRFLEKLKLIANPE